MKEAELQYRIRLLSINDVRLFRNNVGTLQNVRGDFVTYGLCPGSSDLIGWKTHVIMPRDVGTEVAVFTAIEVKGPRGIVTANQRNFIETVKRAGGFAGVAYDLKDAREILRL